jgi:hypothetical protein
MAAIGVSTTSTSTVMAGASLASVTSDSFRLPAA